ncbi:MAG: signal peptidase I [Oleiphilaceae bacterium]|nr:signal peptidase I [Oleiphilaceae bacterium]
MNFPLLLVVLTAVSGLVWLLDARFLRPRRLARYEAQGQGPEAKEEDPDEPWLSEISRSFFPILAIVLVLRSFLVEPFQIPSGSMLPTLEVGDFILVNKFSYGLRLPVVDYKFLELGEPERGDIMVFKFPVDPSINYIKRVVGLPGDRVRYDDKKLFINGEPVPQALIARLSSVDLLAESLAETDHQIFLTRNRHDRQAEGEWQVPEGHYFVLGDNRDNSRDSRYWGMVPDDHVVGRAFAIWMHWESLTSLPRFHRVGTID